VITVMQEGLLRPVEERPMSEGEQP
jgi:hypothetical protein